LVSVLEIKQGISRLSVRERQEIQLYLLRLKHSTPRCRRDTARKIAVMQAGRFTTIEVLEIRYTRD